MKSLVWKSPMGHLWICEGNNRIIRLCLQQESSEQANNKNPILILTPCHRMIYQNGELAGFGCGTQAKRYLLELEKKYI